MGRLKMLSTINESIIIIIKQIVLEENLFTNTNNQNRRKLRELKEMVEIKIQLRNSLTSLVDHYPQYQ